MAPSATLVTGATGHLGANLVRQLLLQGDRVRVLLRPNHDARAVDGLEVERASGDIRDRASLDAAMDGCTRVFHCAAMISITAGGEREIYETNVLGTRNVLSAAARAGVARTVVTGSFSAVGHHPNRASDERDPFNPFAKALPYERSNA